MSHAKQKFDKESVSQLNSFQAMYMQPGEVVLVRSTNVKRLGDHVMVVIDPVVSKEQGRRPKSIIMPANYEVSELLDQYTPHHGATILKLSNEKRNEFMELNNIVLSELVYNSGMEVAHG